MKKFIVLTCFLLLIYSCSRSISLQYTPPEIVSGNTGIDLIENSGAGQTVYISRDCASPTADSVSAASSKAMRVAAEASRCAFSPHKRIFERTKCNC